MRCHGIRWHLGGTSADSEHRPAPHRSMCAVATSRQPCSCCYDIQVQPCYDPQVHPGLVQKSALHTSMSKPLNRSLIEDCKSLLEPLKPCMNLSNPYMNLSSPYVNLPNPCINLSNPASASKSPYVNLYQPLTLCDLGSCTLSGIAYIAKDASMHQTEVCHTPDACCLDVTMFIKHLTH